ncbi:MAG: CHAT domain-containing tetratricopeptide repeat protein [Saprospiraceae bacterium]
MKNLFLSLLLLCSMEAVAQTVDSTVIVQEADSLLSIAKASLRAGKPKEALPVLMQTEAFVQQQLGKRNEVYRNTLQQLTDCLLALGQFDQAETYALEHKQLATELYGLQHTYYGKSVYSLGILYLNRKRMDKAEPYLKECLNIFEKGTLDYAGVLEQLTVLYIQTGRMDAGESLILEAVEIKERLLGKEDKSFLNACSILASLYHRTAKLETAERISYEVWQTRKRIQGDKHPDFALAAQNLAGLYSDMGRYEEAEPILVQALEINRESLGRDNPKCATILFNLGLLYVKTRRTDLAEGAYLESKDIRAKAYGTDNPQYANTLMMLGSVYFLQRRFGDAEKVYLEAIRIFEQEPIALKRSYQYPKALHGLAEAYLWTGKTDRVEDYLLQAKAFNEKTLSPLHPDHNKVIWSLALYYTNTGETEKAIAYYNDGLHLMDSFQRQAERYFSESDLFALRALQKDKLDLFFSFSQYHLSEPKMSANAYDFILNYKNSLLESKTQLQKALRAADSTTRATYDQWVGLHRRLAGEYAKPEIARKGIADMEEQANLLEKNLVQMIGPLPGSGAKYRWQEIRYRLKDDEAAIEFVQFRNVAPNMPDRQYCSALLIRSTSDQPLFIPLFSHESVGNLQAIRQLYSLPQAGNPAGLYNLIAKSLAPHLTGVKTLFYSTAGLLHGINLGAVPLNETEIFGSRFAMHNLGSTRQVAQRASPAPVPESQEALILGGINYDLAEDAASDPIPTRTEYRPDPPGNLALNDAFRSLRDNAWPFLDWTKKEAAAVAAVLGHSGLRTEVYEGEKATEEMLKKIGTAGRPAPRVLHLATHGFFFPDADTASAPGFRSSDHPLIRSGLVLAGANSVWKGEFPPAGREDGILTAYEIAQLDLSRTELVVLSACETGLGELRGNEGIYGLQRGFKIAGARYVLMSLWSVSDRHTYEFMNLFYREWLENKKTIPAAFQAAQNKMRELHNQPPNPALWAGFVLVEQ